MKNSYKNVVNFIIALLVISFNIFLIIYPQNAISAAREGFSLFTTNVLPALFPFIIGTSILMSLGVVSFVGVLLGPIMQKLFNVPGVGGFALVVGLSSGYPMGAKVISELRQKNELTAYQSQRLISFCNNSGPLFIIGAVGIGFYQNVYIGYFIMLIHYTSAIITGILFRVYKKDEKYTKVTPSFKKAYSAMLKTRENKTPATILCDSIVAGVHTILYIGGFIIIFCVIAEVIKTLFFGNLLDNIWLVGNIIGLIEITNGINILSNNNNLLHIIATAALISFGGFSIHAQVLNFISKTDINIKIYFLSKIIHSAITIVLGFLFAPILMLHNTTESVLAANIYISQVNISISLLIFCIGICILLFLSIIVELLKNQSI